MFFRKKEKIEEDFSWSPDQGVLSALIVGLEEGVIVYDKDFRVSNFNKAAEGIFETKASEVVGRTFSLAKVKSFKSKTLAQAIFPSLAPTVIRRSEPGTYPQIIEVSLENPVKELRIVTHKVEDDLGKTWGFIKVIKDRTRELELLRVKSDFITIAAHQLRTPTTALNWALDSLNKDKSLSKESKGELKIARQTAKNLLNTINDLINITQIEEGKFGYSFKKLELNKFLSKLLSAADVIAKEYKVKLYYKRPKSKEVFVSADKARLGLAIANLIDNAIKYNVPNGQVIIGLKKLPNKPMVEISVQDTGVGIPKSDIGKLFTKFFRAKNIEQYGVEGSGLGLFLTKNIIVRHGGTIRVESVENRGSTFYFTLPTDPKLIPLKKLE